MIGEERPAWVRQKIRKVFGSMFAQIEPPPMSRQDVDERITFAGELLAGNFARRDDSGFADMDDADRLEAARRIVWQRWRWENGRLSDDEVTR